MTVEELIQKFVDAEVEGFDVVIANNKRGDDIRLWINDATKLVTLEAVEVTR